MKKKLILSFIFVLFFVTRVAPLSAGGQTAPLELKYVRTLPAEDEENAYFKSPARIAVDDSGYLYAFDPNNHHFIYKLNRKGQLVKTIGRRGSGPGDLFRPFLIKVRDNRLIVMDEKSFSIFDFDGALKGRFRKFINVEGFAVHKGLFYLIQEGTKELFTVYDSRGKQVSAFGEKYALPKSLYKGVRSGFIDGNLHSGQILCSEKFIFFVASTFAEFHKYGYDGRLISKKYIGDMNEKSRRHNIDYFFKRGVKRGENIRTFVLYDDAYLSGGYIYILAPTGNSFYDKILKIDPESLEVIETYVFYHYIDSQKSKFSGMHLAVETRKEDVYFYVSLVNDGDMMPYIKLYKKEVQK